jgi:hypothetical protein
MTMENDTMNALAQLDAAPPRVPSPAEQQRRDAVLHSIIGSPEPPTSLSRTGARVRRRVWWSAGIVGGATAAVAAFGLIVVMVPAVGQQFTNRPLGNGGGTGPATLSAAALSAWTGTPGALDTRSDRGREALDWCRDHLSGDPENTAPVEVALSDLRGQVASVVLTRGEDVTLCLVGPDGSGLSELNGVVPAGLGHDVVQLETGGGHGRGDTGFAYAGGFAGDHVTGLTLHDGGRTIKATIGGGRWTAWWPSSDAQGVDDGSDVTITLRDGTTRTVDYGSLPRPR